MEITRIPSTYLYQLEHMSEKDIKYIFISLLRLSNWEVFDIERSMRWWVLQSLWREAVQMENRANAKKWKKWLKYELATLTATEVATSTAPKSNQIKSNQEKERVKIFSDFISDEKNISIAYYVIEAFLDLWWKPSEEETIESLRDWIIEVFAENGITDPQKMISPIKKWHEYWAWRKKDIKNVKSTFRSTLKFSL